jgi:citrate lyase subunit beta/citryl-CoA lyase
MYMRSMLYVPGDNDRKLSKADNSGADAIVLDLEDSVAATNRPEARNKVRDFLKGRPLGGRKYQLWVRINAFDDSALVDLAAVVNAAPDGIVLPKIDGPHDIERLSYCLDSLEVREGLELGQTKICAVATETPAAVLRLPEFAHAKLPRLVALNWGAEDLSAAIGASTNVDSSGGWALTYRWTRSAVLLAAKAANVQAIETVYVNYRDIEGLRTSSREAAQEGFTGRAAIHPDQVAPINEAFTPSPEEVALARKLVAAFDKAQGVGTVGIDGKMFDIPHLKRARRLLELHESYQRRMSS